MTQYLLSCLAYPFIWCFPALIPDTSASRYHKICMRPAFLHNLYLKSFFAQKNNPHTPRQGIKPCHGFIIFSPPAWAGICKAARHGCLNTLQHPFTPQLSPDAAPAAVFSGRGIIVTRISRQPANAASRRRCRSYFSFFCYDSLFHLHQSPATNF